MGCAGEGGIFALLNKEWMFGTVLALGTSGLKHDGATEHMTFGILDKCGLLHPSNIRSGRYAQIEFYAAECRIHGFH